MTTIIARLRAVLSELSVGPDNGDWAIDWTPYLTENRIPDGLLTMRRVKFASSVLKRVSTAGEAFTVGHALKRLYRDFRTAMIPVLTMKTPIASLMKKRTSTAVAMKQWGGYFDFVIKPAPKTFTRSKFYRDPFTA